MYKIIGKFFDEDIERECDTPDYAIGVFMAYVQKGMRYTDSYTSSDAIDEAIDVSRDVYTNYLVSVPFRGFLFLTPSPGMLDSTALKGLFAAGRIFSRQRKQPLPEKNSPKATIYEERRGFANP